MLYITFNITPCTDKMKLTLWRFWHDTRHWKQPGSFKTDSFGFWSTNLRQFAVIVDIVQQRPKFCFNLVKTMVQMHPTKTPFYYISLIEIGVLSAKIIYVKSLGLQSPNRYEIDLLNEVLNINFGQEAANIPDVKVGVRKKYLPTRLTLGAWVRTWPIGRYFFWTPTLTYCHFAAPWQKWKYSTSFKRSISYLFGNQSPKHLNDF